MSAFDTTAAKSRAVFEHVAVLRAGARVPSIERTCRAMGPAMRPNVELFSGSRSCARSG